MRLKDIPLEIKKSIKSYLRNQKKVTNQFSIKDKSNWKKKFFNKFIILVKKYL